MSAKISVCSRCNVGRPLASSYRYEGECENCHTIRPEGPNTYSSRDKPITAETEDQHLARICARYNITLADYREMERRQGGGCAICGRRYATLGTRRWLFIDHCHETGRVRGLLCQSCNVALGHFKDSTAALARAARYLRNGPGIQT